MTAFALLSAYALFILDPAIFVPGGGSALLPAALAAPLPQDEGDGSDDGGKQDGGETKEPVVLDLDLNKDESITIDDFDALYLALESPEKFEKQYGKSAAETLKALDVDADGEFTDIDLAEFGAQGGAALTLPVCDSGPARAWGAQMNVATYSSVNLFNGNLLTRIPIDSWPSFGPDMDFALYHNSARVGCADDSNSTGFSLGAGWSIAYGGYLLFPTATTIQVVEDDGNVNTFTKSAANWVAPTGIYDKLQQVTAPPPLSGTYWVLTRKNQWRRIYDAQGLLVFHTDSNLKHRAVRSTSTESILPHAIAIRRDGGKIVELWDSSPCRRLDFHYESGSGRLDFIIEQDVVCPGDGRSWHFDYDTSNRVEFITLKNPQSQPIDTISIGYVSGTDHRLATTSDKEQKVFTFSYHSDGKLSTVDDPGIFTSPQSFIYAVNLPLQRWTTTHTDRRGKNWSYVHNSYGGLIEAGNPYSQKKLFGYNASRNRTTVTNELSKTWTSTFDTRGNRLTLTNPLTQKWAWTYDTYNNVLTVTPPLNNSGGTDTTKQVAFEYNDLDNGVLADATNLTKITEPADGQGGSASVTTLMYHYDNGSPTWSSAGQLWQVIDDNDVNTAYEYDVHNGVLEKMSEGSVIGTITTLDFPTEERTVVNNAGQLIGSSNYAGGGDNSGFTANNTPTAATCYSCLETNNPPCTGGGTGDDDPPSDTYLPVDNPADHVPTPICGTTCITMTHDHMGHPLSTSRGIYSPSQKTGPTNYSFEDSIREHNWTYDDLYRLTGYSIKTTEQSWDTTDNWLTRTFSYTLDGNGNPTTTVDPSGNTTVRGFDDANRLTSVTVNSAAVVTYQYYVTGMPQYADYANGVRTEWLYDFAQRCTRIKHSKIGTTLLQIDYVYTPDGLVDSVSQTTSAGTFNIDYTYDKRGRLIREAGSAPLGAGVAFDYGYTYDGVGNRLTKTDYQSNPDIIWTYHYDVQYLNSNGTPSHATWNNRLVWIDKTQNGTLLETVYYEYNLGGQVKRIVTKAPGSNTYYQRSFQYTVGQQCWLMKKYQFEAPVGRTPINVARTKVREFRYDGDRQRYLERERSVSDFTSSLTTDAWRDYDGDNIAGDYSVAMSGGNPVATWQKRYDFGLTLAAQTAAGSPNVTRYVQGDIIGSTRLLTDAAGAIANSFATTAFGETLGTPPTGVTRYGYAGMWGYQSDGLADSGNDFGVMHVGARYYEPGIGRFVQRDPNGIFSGLNTYAYCDANPVLLVDPAGLEGNYASTLTAVGMIGLLVGGLTYDIARANGWSPTPNAYADGKLDDAVNMVEIASGTGLVWKGGRLVFGCIVFVLSHAGSM